MKTLKHAVKLANKKADELNECLFVVHVPGDQYGPYDVCRDNDLDTYYAGIRQDQIVYCTDDIYFD